MVSSSGEHVIACLQHNQLEVILSSSLGLKPSKPCLQFNSAMGIDLDEFNVYGRRYLATSFDRGNLWM